MDSQILYKCIIEYKHSTACNWSIQNRPNIWFQLKVFIFISIEKLFQWIESKLEFHVEYRNKMQMFSENGEQMLSCITDVLAHMQNSIIKLEKVEFWWLGAMSITWASSVPAVNNEKKISLFTMNKQHSERRKRTLKQHTSTRVHKYTHARTYIVTSNLNSICKKKNNNKSLFYNSLKSVFNVLLGIWELIVLIFFGFLSIVSFD